MTGFIVYFKTDNIWIVFISQSGIGIDMVNQGANIFLLGSNGFRIPVYVALIIIIGISSGWFVMFRISITKVGL